ncbi:hypothetical protein B0T26DRAFT_76870 [Lasiosphaeria miniovina]|uniref:Secreted protein n=1 Tax=Lasiosphaeria miniovina TaxID=1954250 RepID=A0AA40EGJ1_9PEZI|nr:uncharacterized protein B0T26DRAFT_76870 [Lasiosphaeria miniovina]KAK0734598.1 hypothetical protein B0T26DRAFT_76870 [Lasiosphaeria miniovina]
MPAFVCAVGVLRSAAASGLCRLFLCQTTLEHIINLPFRSVFLMPFIEISSDDSSSLSPSPSPSPAPAPSTSLSPAPSRWLSLSREDDPYPRRKGGEGDQVDID